MLKLILSLYYLVKILEYFLEIFLIISARIQLNKKININS